MIPASLKRGHIVKRIIVAAILLLSAALLGAAEDSKVTFVGQ